MAGEGLLRECMAPGQIFDAKLQKLQPVRIRLHAFCAAQSFRFIPSPLLRQRRDPTDLETFLG